MDGNPKKKRPQPGNVQSTFATFEDLLKYTYERTPCETKPDECMPRKVKHVIWDADDTIWTVFPHGIASYCHPPFEKLNNNTLSGRCDVAFYHKTNGIEIKREQKESQIILKPKFIETLEKLKEKGIGSSIASNNNPGSVDKVLEGFGIKNEFTSIQSDWNPKIYQVLKIMKETGISGKDIIYVDDNVANAVDVQSKHGALSLAMGYDIISPDEVLNFIKES